MTQRRFLGHTKPARVTTLRDDHPAIVNSTTIFPTRIFKPSQLKRVLKSGHNSRKIGRDVIKGRWKGMPIFTLTLVPRQTCPRSCREWNTCYDAHMQYAQRIEPGPELEDALDRELQQLQFQFPRGFVVRLHVLGDFYSVVYIEKWLRWLVQFPALHVFGYTAHERFSEMGKMLAQPVWRRWAMRFSGSVNERGAITLGPNDRKPAHIVMCPAQTDPERSCSTCALCWNSEVAIGFSRH